MKKLRDMSVREMIKGLLTLQKCIGLKNDNLNCSCNMDELMNCGYDTSNCVADRGDPIIDQEQDKKILKFRR